MLKEIEYKDLVENDYNPRKRFDDAEMTELTESIKKYGLLEPLVTRKRNGKYEVVCGIRRYRALGNINDGDKVPCNIVEVDDHHAMILSFTENFERSDFSAMEEARWFAKALNISLGANEPIPSTNNQAVQALSNEIPSSTATINRRLMLLTLPEKVQNMVESAIKAGGIRLAAAEQISRLRQIGNGDMKTAHKYMLTMAEEYSGETPDLGRLKTEINTLLERFADVKDKEQKKLEELKGALGEKERELQIAMEMTVEWYNKTFETNEKTKLTSNIKKIDDIIICLQDKAQELTASKEFDLLTDKQTELEEARDRYESNLKIIKKEHPNHCPFCGAGVNATNLINRISDSEEEIKSIVNEKKKMSIFKTKVEEKRSSLRKIYLVYEQIRDQYEKLEEE